MNIKRCSTIKGASSFPLKHNNLLSTLYIICTLLFILKSLNNFNELHFFLSNKNLNLYFFPQINGALTMNLLFSLYFQETSTNPCKVSNYFFNSLCSREFFTCFFSTCFFVLLDFFFSLAFS